MTFERDADLQVGVEWGAVGGEEKETVSIGNCFQ